MRLRRRQGNNTSQGRLPHFFHFALIAVMPILIFVLVRLDFVAFAFAVVLLSKWRMLAVKLRHWPANVRANAVDIFAGISTVIAVSSTSTQWLQALFCFLYAVWLLLVKPRSSELWIGLQALIAQTVSLVAIFLVWSNASETGLVFAVWGVTYLCARHFLGAFDEAMSRGSAYVWAFFAASLTWLCSHWLLYFKVISQPALILTVIGYGMAALYYLQHSDRLKKGLRRQFVMLMVAIVLFILMFSNWSGEII